MAIPSNSPVTVHAADREILRGLGEQYAAIAALPVHREKAELWRRMNDLQAVRPMVWITEIPWHEFSEDTEELRLQCQAGWARDLERDLRRTLYQWRHLPVDMIVNNHISCPIAWHSTSFGILRQGDRLEITGGAGIASQHYEPQIQSEADLVKIKDPVVTVYREDTDARFAAMQDVFRDILPVRLRGMDNYWYTPWDNLVMWYGVQEALTDLIERPELINAAVGRIVQCYLKELDQIEALGLLEPNFGNNRVGSGAYCYTSELPRAGYDPARPTAAHLWGCSNAQIFTEVSPAMHWEFALRHDLPWLKRWGLVYYGCCEVLDTKMDILRRIPNLRKVSMNYRINIERGAKAVGADYVYSYKPNPACFATDTWDPVKARTELQRVADSMRGGHVEFVMKDISTVAGHPERLWAWAQLALEVAEGAAN
ncbi:MAG: hypothetical protein H3C27_01650 [Opitutaceae bacterium]|nr:hypothetical protein [Opitutaceae bacterium]